MELNGGHEHDDAEEIKELKKWKSRMKEGAARDWRAEKDPGVKHGPFSPLEDKILKKAAKYYIKKQGFCKSRLLSLLDVKKHKDLKGCWPEIAKALPRRTVSAVSLRTRRILDPGSYLGKWTQEEDKTLRSLAEAKGSQYKSFVDSIGRSRMAIKERWRQIENKNIRHGPWSQEELEQLCELVQKSLQLKKENPEDEPQNKHFRENIDWLAIARAMGTRNYLQCSLTWYRTLAGGPSSWMSSDDHVLLESLQEVDADWEHDVDWDNLVPDRSGAECRQRWDVIVKRLPDGFWSFSEKLEMAARRFAPSLFEGTIGKEGTKGKVGFSPLPWDVAGEEVVASGKESELPVKGKTRDEVELGKDAGKEVARDVCVEGERAKRKERKLGKKKRGKRKGSEMSEGSNGETRSSKRRNKSLGQAL